jgi:hypothetical protein
VRRSTLLEVWNCAKYLDQSIQKVRAASMDRACFVRCYRNRTEDTKDYDTVFMSFKTPVQQWKVLCGTAHLPFSLDTLAIYSLDVLVATFESHLNHDGLLFPILEAFLGSDAHGTGD